MRCPAAFHPAPPEPPGPRLFVARPSSPRVKSLPPRSEGFAMRIAYRYGARTLLGLLVIVTALGVAGCGDRLPPTYQAEGTVTFKEDGKPVTRGTIEFVSVTDPKVRAVGDIQEGKFSLRTLHENYKETSGAVEGEYKVVVELPGSDEDRGRRVAVPGTHKVQTQPNKFAIVIPRPARK